MSVSGDCLSSERETSNSIQLLSPSIHGRNTARCGMCRWVILMADCMVLCFSGTEMGIRVISFRKANSRGVKRYEKARTAYR